MFLFPPQEGKTLLAQVYKATQVLFLLACSGTILDLHIMDKSFRAAASRRQGVPLFPKTHLISKENLLCPSIRPFHVLVLQV